MFLIKFMTMRKLLLVSLFAGTLVLYSCQPAVKKESGPTGAAEDGTYTVLTDSSTIFWKGSMLNIYDHYGYIRIKSGSFTVSNNSVVSGNFEVDMKSISPTDENYSEKTPKQYLVAHLSSADFFAVDSFPVATFVVEKMNADTLYGRFTVRGRTGEEAITGIRFTQQGNALRAEGNLTFNRQKYGVSYSTKMKDRVIKDEIELNIKLLATKNPK